MINNKILIPLLSILFVILISCSLGSSTDSSKKEAPAKQVSSAAKTNNLTGIKTIKCEDSDGTNTTVKGKTTLFYDDGTKQSYSDNCPGKNSPLNVFVQEYFCDGINLKSKIYKCEGMCDDGVCLPPQQNSPNQTNQT